MSSESENNTLNRLLGSQKQEVQTLKEIPYQPTVYAIPKDHWETMLSQLQEQTEFQERLEALFRDGQWHDIQTWAILEEEWRALSARG